MTQSISCSIVLGSSHAGLSDLRAQLYDTAGATVGSAVSTGFVVIGNAANGNYGWTGDVADDFQGFINFYSLATPTIAATVAVNQIDAPTASDIWAYSTRTLTQSAASVISAISGSEITAYRGTTWSIALTGLGNITGYTNLWFAIKQSSIYNTDNESIVLIGVNSGLTRINGAAYATTSDGSITINDATAGDITITLKPAASSLLKVQSDLDYGIKWINASGGEYQLSDGTQKFNITADNPRAIS